VGGSDVLGDPLDQRPAGVSRLEFKIAFHNRLTTTADVL
jgi:hypothetical protein